MKWSDDDADLVAQVLNHRGYAILMRYLDEKVSADRTRLEHPKTDYPDTQYHRGRLSAFAQMRAEYIDHQIRDRRGGADV